MNYGKNTTTDAVNPYALYGKSLFFPSTEFTYCPLCTQHGIVTIVFYCVHSLAAKRWLFSGRLGRLERGTQSEQVRG